MPVATLLRVFSSRELAEWRAYERVAGPLDSSWRDEIMAKLLEFAHDDLYLHSQAHFTDKNKTKGPIEPREKDVPRPRELYNTNE